MHFATILLPTFGFGFAQDNAAFFLVLNTVLEHVLPVGIFSGYVGAVHDNLPKEVEPLTEFHHGIKCLEHQARNNGLPKARLQVCHLLNLWHAQHLQKAWLRLLTMLALLPALISARTAQHALVLQPSRLVAARPRTERCLFAPVGTSLQ